LQSSLQLVKYYYAHLTFPIIAIRVSREERHAVPLESIITSEPHGGWNISQQLRRRRYGTGRLSRYFHTSASDDYTCTFNCNFTGSPFGTLYCLAVVICGHTSVFWCAVPHDSEGESINPKLLRGDDTDSSRQFFCSYYCIVKCYKL